MAKSKLPSLNEITSIGCKLFNDIKTSVKEIITDYQAKHFDDKEDSSAGSKTNSESKPKSKPEKKPAKAAKKPTKTKEKPENKKTS